MSRRSSREHMRIIVNGARICGKSANSREGPIIRAIHPYLPIIHPYLLKPQRYRPLFIDIIFNSTNPSLREEFVRMESEMNAAVAEAELYSVCGQGKYFPAHRQSSEFSRGSWSNREAQDGSDMSSSCYKEEIENLARSTDDTESELLPNSWPEHASVVVRHLIATAKQRVDILAPEADHDLYLSGESLDAIKKFATAGTGGRMRIVVSERKLDQAVAEINNALPNGQRGQVEIYSLPEIIERSEGRNFVVADELSYRIGTRGGAAFAQFGSPTLAQKLAEQFEAVLGKANPVL